MPNDARSHLIEIQGQGFVVADDGEKLPLYPASIGQEQAELLRDLVVRETVSKTIETGLAHGVSALCICVGLMDVGRHGMQHTAIDCNQTTYWRNAGLLTLRRAGVDGLVRFLEEDSSIALPRLIANGESFDFGFVDGDHTFHGALMDLCFLARLIKPGGIVVADDFDILPVAQAVSYVVSNCGWRLESVEENLAILRLERRRVEVDWRDFVKF